MFLSLINFRVNFDSSLGVGRGMVAHYGALFKRLYRYIFHHMNYYHQMTFYITMEIRYIVSDEDSVLLKLRAGV